MSGAGGAGIAREHAESADQDGDEGEHQDQFPLHGILLFLLGSIAPSFDTRQTARAISAPDGPCR